MFKLLRLDERLIHGQVAFAWTNSLSADCILVANDGVAKDKLRATSLKLAAPAEVKFVVNVGTKTWTPSVSVTAEDVENIKGMIEHGAEVECRAVPTDKKVMAETLL